MGGPDKEEAVTQREQATEGRPAALAAASGGQQPVEPPVIGEYPIYPSPLAWRAQTHTGQSILSVARPDRSVEGLVYTVPLILTPPLAGPFYGTRSSGLVAGGEAIAVYDPVA
jgi:hypothetical protein